MNYKTRFMCRMQNALVGEGKYWGRGWGVVAVVEVRG